MAGFFKGLFGGKGKNESSAQPEANQPQQNTQAYYLNMDEARTYGDLNYMRTAKKIRRTFPKTVNNEEMEMEKEVSAMNLVKGDLGTQVPKVSMGSTVTSTPASNTGNTSSTSVPTDAQAAERRKSDSSLDMFRNMAKDIRK